MSKIFVLTKTMPIVVWVTSIP